MSQSQFLNQKPDDPSKPYVFISYARSDAPEDTLAAKEIEQAFVAAGIHCFRDVHVPPGDSWNKLISEALEDCNRMVLVGSSRSMNLDRKEVYLEWFPFEQNEKKIYLFKIDESKPDRRFIDKQYIDAINDREQGLKNLLEAIRPGAGSTFEKRSNPALNSYRQSRIELWSKRRYRLDKRFVNLTLSIDLGEQESDRWKKVETFRAKDLRVILEKTPDDPVLVLLGKPGSGKSTLLRHLEMDLSADQMREDSDQVTFFIQLNEYTPGRDPRAWLIERWAANPFKIGSLDVYLNQHRVLLFLDALNEVPHGSMKEYDQIAAEWRRFAQQATGHGNRIIFSCRERDYGGRLSAKELRVPQVEVQPMDPSQIQGFLDKYVPGQHEKVWNQINDSRQLELYQTPYFLNLLCQVVDETGNVPLGRAALFTSYLRLLLQREANGDLFRQESILSNFDHQFITLGDNDWPDPFTLPTEGQLIPALSRLAFAMQHKGQGPERSQVRVANEEAARMVEYPDNPKDIMDAGVSLNVLDIDPKKKPPVAFYHQLLQEYFAARSLAASPDPALVHVEFEVGKVTPSLEEKLASLADSEPLPLIDQTGWEETILIAAPMAEDPNRFIRDLITHNLPLAARCAASPELSIDAKLKSEIQGLLKARIQDIRVDLRARIAAGEALGTIGDPQFIDRGTCILPPMATIPAGDYPIGDDKSHYPQEKPAHRVSLSEFQIGVFPVTNAEYKKFIDADGYQDERWWDTDEARAWRRGEGSTDGQKQQAMTVRTFVAGKTDEELQRFISQVSFTSEQFDLFKQIRDYSDAEFEQQLEDWFPSGTIYDQPSEWQNINFNNPRQPVVGISWFEARAYCNWLTACAGAEMGRIYRLPTEVEYEAAARGQAGRVYCYGDEFDSAKCNTFESHIRRTTPVGIFDNATPEGAYDLTGNVWSWTLSIFDQDRFPYPYVVGDDREDIHATGVSRPLRGGSWYFARDLARAVCRSVYHPLDRGYDGGFRVVSVVRPPS
jgi:formylglycine-generating enzyme required for sulfatase activity